MPPCLKTLNLFFSPESRPGMEVGSLTAPYVYPVSNPYKPTCLLCMSAVCDISLLLSTDHHASSLIQVAKQLLSDENSPKRRKILTDLLQNLEDRSELETRVEDEDWFQGPALCDVMCPCRCNYQISNLRKLFICPKPFYCSRVTMR